MADIPAYDRYDPVPWNAERGMQIAPSQAPVELAWGSDLLCDPADDDNCDPATGYATPGQRVSEV